MLNRTRSILLLSLLASTPGLAADNGTASEGENWPAWRGPDRNGVARSSAPTTWSEDTNIRWKAELPGLGISTPIVWGGYLYLTTAVETDVIPEGAEEDAQPEAEPEPQGRGGRRGRRGRDKPRNIYEFRVLCVDRKDGSVVWDTKVTESVPHEAGHKTNSQASASPITDGEHIWAFFGSRGLHCLDMKGEVVWSKDLGRMETRNQFGEGASPALHGDTLVVQWDHEGDDFIAAFDKTTGKEKWRQSRDEVTTWSTPLVVPVGDGAQVITTATGASRAYDLDSGAEVWSISGMTTNCIPTPIYEDGVVYLMSGFRGAMLQAIKLEGAKGDLSESENVLWSYEKNTPYVPSGVLTGGNIYFLRVMSGRITCLDAGSGEVKYDAENLGGIRSMYASLTAAGDYIYAASREGETVVVKAGDEYEEVASNVLDDAFDASPVVVDGELYLRGRARLYCIAKMAD